MVDKRVSNKTSITTVAAAIVAVVAVAVARFTGFEMDAALQGAITVILVFAAGYLIPADKGTYVDKAAEVVEAVGPVFPEVFGDWSGADEDEAEDDDAAPEGLADDELPEDAEDETEGDAEPEGYPDEFEAKH